VGGILPGFAGGVRRAGPVARENPRKALVSLGLAGVFGRSSGRSGGLDRGQPIRKALFFH